MLIRCPHVWQHPSCDEFVTPFTAPELTRQVNDEQVSRVRVLRLSAGITAARPTMRSRHVQLIVIRALPKEGQFLRRQRVYNFTSEAARRDVECRGEDYLQVDRAIRGIPDDSGPAPSKAKCAMESVR